MVLALPACAPTPVPANADLDGVLVRRAAAVLAHSEAGWLAAVDRDATAYARSQQAAWPVIARLPVQLWRYQLLGEPVATSHGRWSVRVRLAYQIRGTDDAAVSRDATLTVRRHGGKWLIAGESAPSGVVPWDAAPAEVTSTDGVLLVVSTAAGGANRWGPPVAAAVQRVRRVLGSFRLQPLVIVPPPGYPATPGEGRVHALAAVADGSRVVIAATAAAQLSAAGRVVVLSHELVHVATQLPPSVHRSGIPAWLVEGFADWVGYTGSGLSARSIGAELLADVAVHGAPAALPRDEEFDVTRGGSPQAYESGWLACRLLVDHAGPARLVAFFHDAQRRGVARALATAYSLTLGELVALWRAEALQLSRP